MNKELEALLLTAAKSVGYGVHGVDPKRAAAWGVPLARFTREGEVIPGHSAKAKTTGYYCPRSVWRPKHGMSLMLDHYAQGGGYRLMVLREDTTGQSHFAGHSARMPLAAMKTYLRGIDAGANCK